MKRLLFTIISLFAFIFIGCEKEETVSFGDNGKLIATIENSAITKASLNENENDNSLNVVWQANDSIAVLYKKGDGTILNTVYRLESGTGTTEGVFALSKRNSQPSIPDITGATMVAAVYPCNWDATYDESTNTITGVKLPASYNLNIIGTTTKAPMAYIGSEGKVLFKNVGALVKVKVNNVPSSYNSVELSSATSKLSGSYKISFDNNGVPVASMTDDAANGNSVTFVVSDANRSFYFPILPGTYTDLTVKTKGESVEPIVLIAPKELTATRSNYYNTNTSLTNVTSQSELTSAITGAGTDINVKVDEALNSVSLPSTEAEKTVTLAFTSETENITVTQADGETVAGNVNIIANTANNVDNRELSITLPNSTVEVSGNSTYANITASTADNTLILGKGVNAKKVTVIKGNIKVNKDAYLDNIDFISEGQTVVVIDNGGTISDNVRGNSRVTVMSDAEWNLKNAIKTGVTEITLSEDINLSSPVAVSRDLTVNLNGKSIKCKSSDVFVVTAGTLTINGNGLVYGSEDNSSSSCAVWAKENGKVIINGGTYKVGDDATGKTENGGNGNWRNDCIYARDNASIEIRGGEYMYTGENPAGHTFLLNLKDNQGATLVVKGGTFHKFNPAASNGENPIANFVAPGYSSVAGENNTWTVSEGILNEASLKAAIEANTTEITLGANIDLSSPVAVSRDLTVNLNGKSIKCKSSDVFVVTAGTLTINGNGLVYGSEDNSSSSCAVWAKENGKVIINGGTYKVGDDATGKTENGGNGNWRNDCIYARDNASIEIRGGEYMYTGENPAGHTFLLNLKDNQGATLVVKGGTFHKFNPAASNGENPIANFVAQGYSSVAGENDTWTVVEDGE